MERDVERLLRYPGISPKPANFDEYWKKGIAEIRQMDAQPETRDADFSAPYARCSDLYFTGIGGARIHARYLQPKETTKALPVVFFFHGYTQSARNFVEMLPYVAAGYCAVALDCRGQGGSSTDAGGVSGYTYHGHFIRGLVEEDPEKLLYRSIFLDTVQLVDVVMKMGGIDAERMGAAGYSQGGALALVCASLVPEIKRVAAVFPFLTDYKKAWELLERAEAYAELGDFFRRFDPLHEKEADIFTRLGYIDTQNFVEMLQARVLFAACLADMNCPPETQFAAYNKIKSEKELIVYPDFGHEQVIPGCDDQIFQFMMGI